MRRAWVAICLAAATAGCSTALEDAGSVYLAPGKYDFVSCKDLAVRTKAAAEKEAELTGVMDRAAQEPVGVVVNAFVYRDELNTTQAQLRALRKASAEKRCAAEAPPQATSLAPIR